MDETGREAVLLMYPWMEAFKDKLQDTCHDCGVEIGQRHVPGCDAARCRECHGQHMVCGCDTEPDRWTGLMYPNEHYLCLKHNLWCYDAIVIDGTRHPITSPEMYRLALDLQLQNQPNQQMIDLLNEIAGDPDAYKHRNRVEWHIKCGRDDPGAHADLNSAAMLQGAADDVQQLWI